MRRPIRKIRGEESLAKDVGARIRRGGGDRCGKGRRGEVVNTQELIQAIILGAVTLDDCGNDEFAVLVETRNDVWVTSLISRANLSQVFPDDGTDEGVEGRTLDESLRRLAACVEKKLGRREDATKLALDHLYFATREQ